MIDNAKLARLTDDTRLKAYNALVDMLADKELKALGVSDIYISETRRDLAVQMAYYSRGRMAINDVKKMYAAAGLYAISDKEAQTPNTWTLASKHLDGKAIDLVPVINGRATWSAPQKVWDIMGKIGKENGLEWGGDWDTPDLPHFQI